MLKWSCIRESGNIIYALTSKLFFKYILVCYPILVVWFWALLGRRSSPVIFVVSSSRFRPVYDDPFYVLYVVCAIFTDTISVLIWTNRHSMQQTEYSGLNVMVFIELNQIDCEYKYLYIMHSLLITGASMFRLHTILDCTNSSIAGWNPV
jgi:hypothetical protein